MFPRSEHDTTDKSIYTGVGDGTGVVNLVVLRLSVRKNEYLCILLFESDKTVGIPTPDIISTEQKKFPEKDQSGGGLLPEEKRDETPKVYRQNGTHSLNLRFIPSLDATRIFKGINCGPPTSSITCVSGEGK